MASIVVSSSLLSRPFAGNVAVCLQYLLGLYTLGHEVIYVEEKGWSDCCHDPQTSTVGDFPRAGLALVRELLRRHRARVPVVWLDADAGLVVGMTWPEFRDSIAHADLMLDLGWVRRPQQRTFAGRHAVVDLESDFAGVERRGALAGYDVHFSYGVNFGPSALGTSPADVEWLPTVPPVVPELWKVPAPRAHAPLTTIADWMTHHAEGDEAHSQQEGAIEHLLDLPARVPATLEIALRGEPPALRSRLSGAGWLLCDAADVTASLSAYRDYIARSKAELSFVGAAHVPTRSGWFGDRSASYLAAGRPVITHDTGVGDWLESGVGVLTFASPEQAAEAVERVDRELVVHSLAARALAHEVFHYSSVLRRLLERALPSRLQVA